MSTKFYDFAAMAPRSPVRHLRKQQAAAEPDAALDEVLQGVCGAPVSVYIAKSNN
jgi:hypothetical protein